MAPGDPRVAVLAVARVRAERKKGFVVGCRLPRWPHGPIPEADVLVRSDIGDALSQAELLTATRYTSHPGWFSARERTR